MCLPASARYFAEKGMHIHGTLLADWMNELYMVSDLGLRLSSEDFERFRDSLRCDLPDRSDLGLFLWDFFVATLGTFGIAKLLSEEITVCGLPLTLNLAFWTFCTASSFNSGLLSYDAQVSSETARCANCLVRRKFPELWTAPLNSACCISTISSSRLIRVGILHGLWCKMSFTYELKLSDRLVVKSCGTMSPSCIRGSTLNFNIFEHVKGYRDSCMYSKNKGGITFYTNRETPCILKYYLRDREDTVGGWERERGGGEMPMRDTIMLYYSGRKDSFLLQLGWVGFLLLWLGRVALPLPRLNKISVT